MSDLLASIPWGLIAPLFALQLILMIAALISVAKQEKANGPKWLWVCIIILVNLIGPILYFVVGRRAD